MRPKSKGSGIMVSDYVSERDGYLALTENEYQRAKRVDPSIRMYARQLLEYVWIEECSQGPWPESSMSS